MPTLKMVMTALAISVTCAAPSARSEKHLDAALGRLNETLRGPDGLVNALDLPVPKAPSTLEHFTHALTTSASLQTVHALGKYRPGMCYGIGEQSCAADGSWYCCQSPECNLQRSCASNHGLFGCACPLEPPGACSHRSEAACTGICFWADGGCRTDMQAGAKGLLGDKGPKGDKGDKGDMGDQGPPGVGTDSLQSEVDAMKALIETQSLQLQSAQSQLGMIQSQQSQLKNEHQSEINDLKSEITNVLAELEIQIIYNREQQKQGGDTKKSPIDELRNPSSELMKCYNSCILKKLDANKISLGSGGRVNCENMCGHLKAP